MRIPPTLFHFALMASLSMTGHAADLTVQIEGMTSDEGHVLILVAADEAAWNNQAAPAASDRLAASMPNVTAEFPSLPPGRYAIQVLHDRNGNGQLDSNVVGMPIEPYGFSNNPQVMRKATFDEAAIELTEAGTRITIELN